MRAAALRGGAGYPIGSSVAFETWATTVDKQDLAEPFTFVVDVDGVLRLAARRSEHVACAASGDVLSAGEITFWRGPGGWTVNEVTTSQRATAPTFTHGQRSPMHSAVLAWATRAGSPRCSCSAAVLNARSET